MVKQQVVLASRLSHQGKGSTQTLHQHLDRPQSGSERIGYYRNQTIVSPETWPEFYLRLWTGHYSFERVFLGADE